MEGRFVTKRQGKQIFIFVFFFLNLLEQFLMYVKGCFPFNKATVKYLYVFILFFFEAILMLRVGTTSRVPWKTAGYLI